MRTALLAAVAALIATSASATTISFTSSGAFAAALSGTSVQAETYATGFTNSEDLTPGTSVHGITCTPLGLTIGATDLDITNAFGSFSGLSLGADHTAIASTYTYFFGGEGATLTFASPVTAIGVFFNVNANSGSYEVAAPGGSAASGSSSADASGFVFAGLISSTPFTSANFFSTDANFGVFNVPEIEFAPAATSVPEPSTLVLIVSAAVLGVVVRQSRAKRA